MPEIERLSESTEWVDSSFVQRERTPRWAIDVGIRCHLAGMSLRDSRAHLNELGTGHSQVAIHSRVHDAALQLNTTLSANQIVVDERTIRLHDRRLWLYGTVNPQVNEILTWGLSPRTNRTTTR